MTLVYNVFVGKIISHLFFNKKTVMPTRCHVDRVQSQQYGPGDVFSHKLADKFTKLLQQSASSLPSTSNDADGAQSQQLSALRPQ